MGTGPEVSPQGAGRFVLWLGIALVVVLGMIVVFLHFNGHKPGLMKNSRIDYHKIVWRG